MKKYLVLILGLVLLIGCSKEEFIEEEIVIDIPIAVNPYKVVNQIDYRQASYHTRIPFPEQVTSYRPGSDWHPALEAVVLDYDKDGYLDIVETQSEYGVFTRNKIIFMKGTEEGTLVKDEYNSDIYEGLIHGRKGLVGDYNNDGWPDIFFIGHGYDKFGEGIPNEEHPILLLNEEGKSFKYLPILNVVGFFHTGTSGDIDGDGDLDVLLIDGAGGGMNSYVLTNNGDGTFIEERLGYYEKFPLSAIPNIRGKFSSELYDLDNDGDLDLILAGHEYEEWNTPGLVLMNTPDGFVEEIELPIEPEWGIVNDIDFYDLDNDGTVEIIYSSTKSNPFYQGFKVRVYTLQGEDITANHFDGTTNMESNGRWLYWMSIVEKEDGVYFQGDDMFTQTTWKIEQSKFNRVR